MSDTPFRDHFMRGTQSDRDRRDGAAIRHLSTYLQSIDPDMYLVVVGPIPETGWSVRVHVNHGIVTAQDAPSVAEAAGKCREVLA